MAKAKTNKKIAGYIKLQVPAGKANPAPPIGPALGQKGVNIMEFCKAFNAATQSKKPGMPIPVIITVYADRSFTYEMKAPPASYFIAEAIGLAKGSGEPGRTSAGKITTSKLRDIAKDKMVDMNANSVEAAVKTLAGSARSMGIEVVEG